MSGLEIEGVVKDYGVFRAIKDVSFSVAPGEFVVMVGPSGCGKSTLLRAIAGLERITSGTIRISGRDVTDEQPSDRGVAMVFQNYALYPHMTVRQNMGFALKIAGRPKSEIDTAVQRAAQILRISDQLDKKPKALSGGQRQRVAIGRAITRAPEVFLFDEPLSNLDAALRSQMRVELGRLHAELRATMVYVTHDQTEAMTMGDRIVVLNNGLIEQVGSPLELYNRPRNRFVAGFLGSPRMNFIEARVSAITGRSVFVTAGNLPPLSISLKEGARLPAVGDVVAVGIRPEGFGEDGSGDWIIPARVAVLESLGRETLVYADGGSLRAFDSESQEGLFAVHRSSQLMAVPGDAITLSVSQNAVYLFDETGNTLHFPMAGSATHSH